VSWFKLALWLLIAITSLPLHLLFNSSVYDTDADTEFIVVLANEGFVQGGNYSLPGVGWEFYDGNPFRVTTPSRLETLTIPSPSCEKLTTSQNLLLDGKGLTVPNVMTHIAEPLVAETVDI
jgi:hypothetical protein